jgi:NADH-quinone oxidoreductase subunit L
MIKLAALSILILPLFSSIINGFFRNSLTRLSSAIIACTALSITAIAAIYIFCTLGSPIHIFLTNWLVIDGTSASWSIYIDRLSATMFAVVTIVSAVVHIYSVGYMEDDPHIQKFFCFLSLFTFFMLMLVSADNFLQLFFGWEGVGLCSYLLIGFWHLKPAANAAAIKAFIVNRISDFAFILGIVLLVIYTNSFDFNVIFSQIPLMIDIGCNIFGYEFNIVDIICLLLFIGCMGKSAQIGLHVWLPDAMEGPTPVSALIHAATMVTAGVFLLAKCSYLFEYSPFVLNIIAIVGGITAIFAASIAIAQTDIKKIIAYSTCSQLGYMFLACGLSAYRAAIFHLVTHAFFKALLFLSAGSVIHMSHEQDITKMGDLKDKMPITYANFLAGSLAIIGIFPLAGFYSKDMILESAYNASLIGNIVFCLGIIAAFCTALYSTKIIILAFHGRSNSSLRATSWERGNPAYATDKMDCRVGSEEPPRNDDNEAVHEAPKIMNAPLMILITGTFCAGMLGYYILHIDKESGYLLNSVFSLHTKGHENIPIVIKMLPSLIGICGIMFGVVIYGASLFKEQNGSVLYKILKNKYYFDEIYNLTIVKFTTTLSCLSNLFDQNFIDKFGPGSFVQITNYASNKAQRLQKGYIVNYAFIMTSAIMCFTTYFIINFIIMH